jgi:hypothetical protein
MTRLLRLAAWGIAIGGVVDPAIALSGASRARLAVVVAQPSSAAADAARDRLTRDLSASYDIVPHVVSDAAAAIVIGERYPDEAVPDTMLVATVSASDAAAPGVRIVGIDAPSAVPAATLIHLDVELEASLVAGRTTDVTASIAGLEIARVSHRWTADRERWHARIDAVPVGDPPYVVRVRLMPDSTETKSEVSGFSRTAETVPIASDFHGTVADVVVDVRRTPLRVEFYDPRPSWATTFLRRALEADARFQVATLSVTSRGVFAQTGGAVPPGDTRLDGFDVVILGGLDRLSVAEATSLDRYMRARGGAVVVVPDQRIDAGPARDLVSGGQPARDPVSGSVRLEPDLAERLLEQPATLTVTPPAASLRASELLLMRVVAPGSEVIARVPDVDPAKALPVIVSAPRGSGRLLLSGAMDAWRFRAADNAAFDRFWQSTIAGLALAVVPAIAIGVDPPLLRPGEPGDLIVRVRSRDVTAVSASVDGDRPVRLVPEAEAGVYRGRFVAKQTPGLSTIEVRAAAAQPLSASHRFVVSADIHRLPRNGALLAMLASSHRGIDVSPDRIPELERFVRGAVIAPRTRQIRHPMRSVWWMLPFAVCLSGEWWIRRRRGLR